MGTGNSPNVAVLIISFNGLHFIDDCLESYSSNNYKNFQIFLIDNGSDDGTRDYVNKKFSQIEVIRIKRNRGYSGGFNYGLRHVLEKYTPDYFLLSNNDVRADNNLISALVNTAETDSKIGFVTGKVYFYDVNGKKNILQTVGKAKCPNSIVGEMIGNKEEDMGQFDEVSERYLCDDVYILVRRDVVEKTGGYDEVLFHSPSIQFEETDWQLRSKKYGYKIYFTPEAKIWHRVGLSTGGPNSPWRHFYSKRNRIILVKRHGHDMMFGKFLLLELLYKLPISLLLQIVRNRTDLLYSELTGTLSGVIKIIQES